MALLETFHLEHLPPSYGVHVALFRDVKNAPFLREQLISGNAEFEYAFIDATMVVSIFQSLSAAYRALRDLLDNNLSTRNVHSETVFSLSPSHNITESFRRFGISPTTTSLLIIKISDTLTAESVKTHLSTVIEGTPVPFTDEEISQITDVAKVKKYYKLGVVDGGKKKKKGDLVNTHVFSGKELEVAVMGAMALRSLA